MNGKQTVRAARKLVDNLMAIEGEIRENHPEVEIWMDRLVVKGMKTRLTRGFEKLGLDPEKFYDEMSAIMRVEQQFSSVPPVSVDQAFYAHSTLSGMVGGSYEGAEIQ